LHTLCRTGNFVNNAQPRHSQYKHSVFPRNVFSQYIHLCVNQSMPLGFTFLLLPWTEGF
jgi:hypothetical protein